MLFFDLEQPQTLKPLDKYNFASLLPIPLDVPVMKIFFYYSNFIIPPDKSNQHQNPLIILVFLF